MAIGDEWKTNRIKSKPTPGHIKVAKAVLLVTLGSGDGLRAVPAASLRADGRLDGQNELCQVSYSRKWRIGLFAGPMPDDRADEELLIHSMTLLEDGLVDDKADDTLVVRTHS